MGDPAKQIQIRGKPSMRLTGGDQTSRKTPGTPGRKKGATINKAAEIRAVASEMIKRGERPRPTEIARELEKKHISVKPSQVSMALRGTGMEARPSRAQFPPPFDSMPNPATAMSRVSVHDLAAVRELLKEMGSMEKLVAAVVAYVHLGVKGGQ